MACGELAALRLGLARTMGIDDPAATQHDLAELGDAAEKPGPLSRLAKADHFEGLCNHYGDSLLELAESVAAKGDRDPKIGYYRTLQVITRKVELELERQKTALTKIYEELDEMHDYIHEVHPE